MDGRALGLEHDAQEIYFQSMLIERKFGGTFRVDLEGQVVTKVR